MKGSHAEHEAMILELLDYDELDRETRDQDTIDLEWRAAARRAAAYDRLRDEDPPQPRLRDEDIPF